LIDHFIASTNQKLNKNIKGLTKGALKALYDYDWPGNVRELENTIERCIILSEGELIDTSILPQHLRDTSSGHSMPKNGAIFTEDAPIIPFEKLKEEAIKHALKITDNNIVEASKKLKIGRATFYRLMEKYNINSKTNN